jgi:hypothetical protein
MPRGCRPASRSALANGGTDSTKQRFVPPPSAIDLGHCHAQYSAYPATAQRGGHADLVGLPPRRKRGLLPHNQDDGVDAHMFLAAVGCHQPAQKRLLAVVAIGPSELNRQWNALPITNQMTLAAELGPIGRIGTCLWPPKTARIELPSTIARDQSIFWERESQSRSTKWINCQIPASCQSRKRRQQVMPDPHPSSWGSISQGTPLRNTNTMPARHARSAKRGLPPLGLALGVGMKGSMSSHNLSGRSAAGIGESSWIEGYTWCRSGRSRDGGFVRGT